MKRFQQAVFALLTAAILFLTTPLAAPPRGLQLSFLDVGKGDALLVQTAAGKTVLIDAGTRRQGEETLVPFLRQQGIAALDMAIVTHRHSDHAGGIPAVLAALPVGMLCDSGLATDHTDVQRYRQVAAEHGVPVAVLERGQTLELDPQTHLQVLGPGPVSKAGSTNNTSLILRLTYGRTAFLLMADAQALAEQELLASHAPLDAQVLQVGHHGNAQSTSAALLRAVLPTHAVISVDADNRQGYPHAAVLDRLKTVGAQLWRTDQQGTIHAFTDGTTVQIHTDNDKAL